MHSIDGGITLELNQKIVNITDKLAQQWQNDKALLTFTKMLRALSDYTASGKSNVNRDAISLIRSIVTQIDNLSTPSGSSLTIAKKQAILAQEIAKYNALKQQIKSISRDDKSEDDYSSDSQNQVREETDSSLISELKGIILSLDWEITEELIQKLEKEVNKLQSHWKNSKIHLSFLQMFKSIGNYVLNRGSNTHPDAISLLNSLYKNFELIVSNSSMTIEDQKNILLKEMKKFNELKQLISSAKISKPRPDITASHFTSSAASSSVKTRSAPTMSPMDDLIGTKSSSNLSPVDELIEEIHMLQDSGSHSSVDTNITSHASGSANTNPEIKEVIPNRLKKQPIEEIQTRLDAFFDEDEPLSELAFADSGDEVVPYKGDTTTSGYATVEKEYKPDSTDNILEDSQEILFEDEPLSDVEPDTQDISFEDEKVEGMVPYEFENEFFESELSPEPEDKVLNVKEISTEEIGSISEINKSKEMELLEELKSAFGKSLFHGELQSIEQINYNITTLEQLWSEEPAKQIMLKIVKSLIGYFNLIETLPKAEALELMLYIVESMENTSDNVNKEAIPTNKNGEKISENDIIKLFSKYIDFQNRLIKSNTAEPQQNKAETLADREILYSEPNQQEEEFEIEDSIRQKQSIWSKIKRWLGL